MKKVKEKDWAEEEENFNIPSIPEPPKINKITIDSPGLSTSLLNRIKKLERKDNRVVLVNCERCKEVIPVPIPKSYINNSDLPVVPVSYIHKNKERKDQHCITLHLDHDFDIRRQRISDVIFSPD
ncbi:MAG: hypothetical protein EAX89_12210 [Candidatus Lokiarchaeota archaeon]|nr:hypothetical protein [Candidatus Lokiarchaeota archaeon]